MSCFVYTLRFNNDSLYIGQTNNLKEGVKEHGEKKTKASKFSKEHGSFELVYRERFNNRLESMRREKQLKGWKRAEKEA